MLSPNLTIKSFHKIYKTLTICKLGLNTYSQIIDLFQSSREYSGPLSPNQKSVFQSDLHLTNWRWGWRHTMTNYGQPQKLNIKQNVLLREATLHLGLSDPDAFWGHQLMVKVRSPLDHPSICISNKSSPWDEQICLYSKVAKCRTNSCNVP